MSAINWEIVTTVGAPIITLFIGAWVTRLFENKANLVSYYGHVASFTHKPAQGTTLVVNTHAVVLRNTGRTAATNVRLHHFTLPDFTIYPHLQYSVDELPGGGSDIVIPTLVPGEEITVSYLYFPPLTFARVNAGIKSDQGLARQIPVLLQRIYPKWFNISAALLLLVGIVATLYLIAIGIKALIA